MGTWLATVGHRLASLQWGNVVSWVGAAISLLGYRASRRQAHSATKAADDARAALALALRPTFAFSDATDHARVEFKNRLVVGVTNTAAFDAVDVTQRVTADGGRVLGEATADRMPGKVPGTLLDPDLTLELELTPEMLAGNRMELTFTVRSRDQEGIQWWEQRGRLVWALVHGTAHSQMFGPVGNPVDIDHGEPKQYNPPEA